MKKRDQWSGVVDYSRESFLNADMLFSEFAGLCHDRSEAVVQSVASIWVLRVYLVSVLIRALPFSIEKFSWLRSLRRDWYQACRYVYAQELCKVNNILAAYNGRRDLKRNVTIHARNELVERILFRELGGTKRRAAVYFGAVHMPDFERRLLARGFHRAGVDWLDCWDVRRTN